MPARQSKRNQRKGFLQIQANDRHRDAPEVDSGIDARFSNNIIVDVSSAKVSEKKMKTTPVQQTKPSVAPDIIGNNLININSKTNIRALRESWSLRLELEKKQ